MTSEQALFLRDYLLPAIEEEFLATRRVLAAVPEEQTTYRPDPKSRTAGELAWHIVATELKFFEDIARGSFAGSDQEAHNPTRSLAELIGHYETNFKLSVEQIRKMSGEQLATPINFFGIADLPAVAYLSWLNNHTIHHRGQLSASLRSMGSRVPAIYGPSADEMWTPQESTAKA
jgi:uncharacterized damage-inducible protein DinB